MEYGIRGSCAVVTGADSGMGLAAARMLLDEGVRVVICDRVPDRLADAARLLSDRGDVHAITTDLTKLADVERLRNEALAHLGRVDILVNAAGITGAQGPFHEIDDDGCLETPQTDFMGAVRIVRAFVPGMMAQGSGKIVLFGSEDAEQPYPVELPYCAAKAAILNLAKGLSKTYAKHGIRVNAIGPAFIATPMTDAMTKKRAKERGETFDAAIESFLKEERPALESQRRGDAGEVAAAVLFLCSAQASFIHGTNLRVDGGSVATV